MASSKAEPRRHLVIPDCQDGPDRPKDHLRWAGKYIAEKRPDVVVQLGDLGDFGSLSSYDKGKKTIEGKRLSADWDSFRRAVDELEKPFERCNGYRPRKVYTAGNHEQRVQRYHVDNPQLDTLPDTLGYMRSRGWEVHPYLGIAEVDGVHYSHLFARTSTGRVTDSSQRFGAPTAIAQAKANMMTCVAGHKPGFDYALLPAHNHTIHSLIAGSFYPWAEEYMTVQGNSYWRGILMLHEVRGGEFDLMQVSLNYLKRKFGK